MLVKASLLLEIDVQGHWTPQVPILLVILLSLRGGSLSVDSDQHHLKRAYNFLSSCRED